jgi:23S rRNA pseudouridine2605 synthase
MEERLQKIIARAGIASRRRAEQLILAGAVTVNGRVVTVLGTKADPLRDHITVGPRTIRPQDLRRAQPLYYAFHKPAQVVSTMDDPERRPCLGPYLRGFARRVFPVGRLEFDASGLLLLTSDGEMASRLMQTAAGLAQRWRVKVKGRIPDETRRAIEQEARVRMQLARDAANPWYDVELRGARRDVLRHTLGRHQILVEKMVRTGVDGVELGAIAAGQSRALDTEEIASLRRAAAGPVSRGPRSLRRTEPQAPQRSKRRGRTGGRDHAPLAGQGRAGHDRRQTQE